MDLNLYQRLGLHELGDGVGVEEVKLAYHKALLLYHPDKTGKGEDDEAFLGIQEAFSTLTDETKRKAYDSHNMFDESLPTGREKPEDFYKVYGPIFKSNARFAVKKPAPELGDDETPLDVVNNFYKYWSKFESWRDFTLAKGAQEHDVDSADSREEKRWMMKENMKGVKNMKKKEIQRVAKLVDLALSRDPRLRRAALAAKEKKNAAKNAKKAALEKEKAEKEAAEKATKAAAEAEEEAKRKDAKEKKATKDGKKKKVRQLRSTIRKLVAQAMQDAAASPRIEEYDVDLICEKIGARDTAISDLEALIETFGDVTYGEGGKVSSTPEGLKTGCAAVVVALDAAKAEG